MKWIALIALLLAGCSSGTEDERQATPDTTLHGTLTVTADTTEEIEPAIALRAEDDSRTVDAPVGRFVEVSLMANAKKDEQWSLVDAAPAVFEKAGTISYMDEASGSRFQTFRFRAKTAGQASLSFERKGGDKPGSLHYTIVVR